MPRPEPAEVERVAVLGAGTIGASWTAQFLARGLSVAVYDPAPDCEVRVREFIEAAWPTLERLGLPAGADATRVSFHDDPAAAVEGVALVQENGPENLDVKRTLFARIDAALAPETVVASSTSGFMPSELQAGRRGPRALRGRAPVQSAAPDSAGRGRRRARHRSCGGRLDRRLLRGARQAADQDQARDARPRRQPHAGGALSRGDPPRARGRRQHRGRGRRDRLRPRPALGADGAAHGAPSGGRPRRPAPSARAHRTGHRALVERPRPTRSDAGGDRSAGRGVRRGPRRARSRSWRRSGMRCWSLSWRPCRPRAANAPTARKVAGHERTSRLLVAPVRVLSLSRAPRASSPGCPDRASRAVRHSLGTPGSAPIRQIARARCPNTAAGRTGLNIR